MTADESVRAALRKMATTALRERSGEVTSSDPMVSLFYELMRDAVPPGELERIVVNVCIENTPVVFTNGYLARYAQDLADRLRAKEQASKEVNDDRNVRQLGPHDHDG